MKGGSRRNRWKKLRRKRLLLDYKQISDYGIIGDQRTCALVGIDGSIDWLCLPRFDSPSVFNAILDRKSGGSFRILPDYDEFESYQHYVPNTNILVTEFRTGSGNRARIVDFMPCFHVNNVAISSGEAHRQITCLAGDFRLQVSILPRMNYGQIAPVVDSLEGVGYSFKSKDPHVRQEFVILTPLKFHRVANGGISTELKLTASGTKDGGRRESAGRAKAETIVLRHGPAGSHVSHETYTDLKLRETRNYWTGWIGKCTYSGPWRREVKRSALVLSLLLYSPTGAIIAAPTTSLPEELGGSRNWDYRFSWIRDSSFVLWAMHSLGLDLVEGPYLDWVTSIFYLMAGNMQVMLGINGERDLSEQELDYLPGYKNSRPVRIGNGAWNQFQLDVYGILLDALYFSHVHGGGIDDKIYQHLVRPLIQTVEANWQKPDCGIWEVRGRMENFVYSKMWCWVALDRAIKMARKVGASSDVDRWSALRENIRGAILSRGWDDSVGSFVRSFGSKSLDAANLLMPQVGFIDARDPRMQATINQTVNKLLSKKKFVHRYLADDGLPGREGAFLVCSFWLVNCLTASGRLKEAKHLLSKLLKCSNHLGLFSEEIDPRDESALGNFPQAFTHMGMITAVVNLNAARSKGAAR